MKATGNYRLIQRIDALEERVYELEDKIKILSNERETVRKHEQQKRSCSNCKYVDGIRCKHPDNCESDDLENWEQL